MREIFGGMGIVQEKGIDFMPVGMDGLEEINQYLSFTSNTAPNILGLPKELQEEIKLLKPKEEEYIILLKEIFKSLGIKSYKLVNTTLIEGLKDQGVIYVLWINGFGDLHFTPIDGHFNFDKTPSNAVLLYETEKPKNQIDNFKDYVSDRVKLYFRPIFYIRDIVRDRVAQLLNNK